MNLFLLFHSTSQLAGSWANFSPVLLLTFCLKRFNKHNLKISLQIYSKKKEIKNKTVKLWRILGVKCTKRTEWLLPPIQLFGYWLNQTNRREDGLKTCNYLLQASTDVHFHHFKTSSLSFISNLFCWRFFRLFRWRFFRLFLKEFKTAFSELNNQDHSTMIWMKW